MTLNLSTAIREINQEKGISEELIQETIESALTHAYKKYYGTLENLSIRVSDGFTFTVNSIKEVVEELDDDLFEIELSEAVKFVPSAKLGDKLEIPCDPKEFGQLAIHSAKQTILQRLKEIEKNTKLSNFKRKEGEIKFSREKTVPEKSSRRLSIIWTAVLSHHRTCRSAYGGSVT